MRVAVSGPSGKLGRLVVLALLERGPTHDLILVSRSPDLLATVADRGALVRYRDFERPESLPDAFAGAGRLLVIGTVGSRDTAAARRAAFDAAARVGVGHAVYTSVTNPVARSPFPLPPRICVARRICVRRASRGRSPQRLVGGSARADRSAVCRRRALTEFAADPVNAEFFELFTATGIAIRIGYLAGVGAGIQTLIGSATVPIREFLPPHGSLPDEPDEAG